jgi:hypothetical protein
LWTLLLGGPDERNEPDWNRALLDDTLGCPGNQEQILICAADGDHQAPGGGKLID